MRSVLDRSDREDVRLHQPRCANTSAFGLQGYVDTRSRLVAMHLLDRSCVIVGKFLNYYVPQQWHLSQVYAKILYARVEHNEFWAIIFILLTTNVLF